MTDVLLESPEPGIALLTLDRPERRNAVDGPTAEKLGEAYHRFVADDDARVLVLTGEGPEAFCAGADLKERRLLPPDERAAHTTAIETAAEALAALPMPTVAAVRGFALAGGAELAIACDLRVAAEDATFGFPEVKVGIFPGAGGALRLPRIVGGGAARDLLYTGRRITAEDAFRLGLVDRLTPSESVVEAAAELAASIAANAPLAVRAVKRALEESQGTRPDEARRVVNTLRAALDSTADYEEGLAAFAERRAPRFTGR